MTTKIGVDFDNTLINYDNIFERYIKKFNFGKPYKKNKKLYLKKKLISKKSETVWTSLQAIIYGIDIGHANPFDYACSVLNLLSNIKGFEIFIISHKTKKAVANDKVNLHFAAKNWIKQNNFFHGKDKKWLKNHIFFETSLLKKINRIKKIKCDVFVDDLPEVLDLLPNNILKVLFSHSEDIRKNKKYKVINSWKHFTKNFF